VSCSMLKGYLGCRFSYKLVTYALRPDGQQMSPSPTPRGYIAYGSFVSSHITYQVHDLLPVLLESLPSTVGSGSGLTSGLACMVICSQAAPPRMAWPVSR
jgi:hypothetical protein